MCNSACHLTSETLWSHLKRAIKLEAKVAFCGQPLFWFERVRVKPIIILMIKEL